MKPRSFLIPVLLLCLAGVPLVIVSCSKSSSANPTLTLESISSPVQPNDSMRVHFKFTGGDKISNGMFWVYRDRLNLQPYNNNSGGDTVSFQMPKFSANTGEISFSLPWQGFLNETYTENDTDIFRFFIQMPDTTLTTDTITSPKVIVLFQ